MPPIDTTPQSQIRYFTRIIAALVIQAGGELRVPQKFMREVAAESSRQGLFEDSDARADEIVLRFGSKNSAVYPVEPDTPCDSPKPRSVTPQTLSPQVSVDPSSRPMTGRPPMTDQQLALVEEKVRKARVAARMKNARGQANSSEISELNFPV